MNSFVENLTGLNALTDQVIAMDLLNSAKSGVRNYAFAVTEAGTPEIKEILIRHLEDSINLHEQVSSYMIEQGWYHPRNKNEQINLNLQNIETALNLPLL
ncbi:spore coat protein [Bacillus sp. CGMCC 1.16607]|uniref:spore coat protein n=1 Tax=Bacillus sp. CGMCC 1.16607 TaxID=3351842 RepID=UPI0036456549